MMKYVTILNFDDMERIRQDIDVMMDDAKYGASGEYDAKNVCDWLVEDLKKLRSQFE